MAGTIEQYGALAREKFPALVSSSTSLFVRDNDPVSIGTRNSIAAFDAVGLRPRVMVDIDQINLATTILGERISFPVMIAPAGGHARFCADGELATVRAAGSAGTLLALSTVSSFSLEDVAGAASGPLWFELYMLKNRRIAEQLLRRAEKAGYKAIVVPVDNAGYHPSEMDNLNTRVRYADTYANFAPKDFPGIPAEDLPVRTNYFEAKATFVWEDLTWLRSITRLPVVIKGIQTAEDAWLCAKNGVEALVVSNHGGHGLLGANGTLKMLPEVVAAVGDEVEVYLDGGVRWGWDVLKALAMGARAVLIGRPYMWGLMAEGEAGVRGVLEILRHELTDAMGNCGVTDVHAVGPWMLNTPASIGITSDPVYQLMALSRLLTTGEITAAEHATLKARVLARLT